MKTYIKIFTFAGVALMLSSCVSFFETIDVNYYTLNSNIPQKAAKLVPLGRIVVATYLNRPQIVCRKNDSLIYDNEKNWAESLTRSFQRVLPRDISSLLSTEKITQLDRIDVYIDTFEFLLDDNNQYNEFLLNARILLKKKNIQDKDDEFVLPIEIWKINKTKEFNVQIVNESVSELSKKIATYILESLKND